MAINATNSFTPRELTPAGNYVARCYSMIEIGTVKTEYKGQAKILHKVRVTWELPYEMKVFNEEKGPQPLVISKEYTLSMADKATLRHDLQSWRGKAFTEQEAKSFDITKLIGATCMINLVHKPSKSDPSKIYEEITAITPLPKGMVCPEQINPTFILSFDEWDEAKFEKLPTFIQEKIKSSAEYQKMFDPNQEVKVDQAATVNDIDDLPF